MSRGLLFIGGAGPPLRKLSLLIRPEDVICAADSGLDAALAADVKPDGVVGDMDSLSDPALLEDFPPHAVERHPGEKDFTDTELGLNWLRRRACRPLILIGGGEGRLDHTLALKMLFDGQNPPDAWYTAREAIYPIEGALRLKGMKNDAISFFPVGRGPWKIASRGLKWELAACDWENSMSLSNQFTADNVSLTVVSGRFLMIRPIDTIRRFP